MCAHRASLSSLLTNRDVDSSADLEWIFFFPRRASIIEGGRVGIPVEPNTIPVRAHGAGARSPCEWRFNDRGLPRRLAYHVCTFVTRHNVSIVDPCDRVASLECNEYTRPQGQGVADFCVSIIRSSFAPDLSISASTFSSKLIKHAHRSFSGEESICNWLKNLYSRERTFGDFETPPKLSRMAP